MSLPIPFLHERCMSHLQSSSSGSSRVLAERPAAPSLRRSTRAGAQQHRVRASSAIRSTTNGTGSSGADSSDDALSQQHSQSVVDAYVVSSRNGRVLQQKERGPKGGGKVHVPDLTAPLFSPAAPSTVQVDSSKHAGNLHAQTDEGVTKTQFVAETLLPTRHGKLRLRGYKHSVDGGLTFTEPTAIISGNVEGQEDVPVRVHDACFTSEVLGSLKCDCSDQLNLAIDMISASPPGMVIYLQQEGRGIGLANKIAAYALQEQGLDTVDANRALGLPDDSREYTSVRNILLGLGVKSIQLITNNPRKINEMKALGLEITGRIPCIVNNYNEHNEMYLQAKQDRMDHLLDGQFCYWNHNESEIGAAAALATGVKVDLNGKAVPAVTRAAASKALMKGVSENGTGKGSQRKL